MVSNVRPEGSQNWGDNVFKGLSVGPEESGLVSTYFAAHDLAPNTRRAIRNDLRKFAAWFSHANREPFAVKRITVRDVTDFKDHLRRKQGQAVSTVNRALVTIRRFLAWLGENGHLKANPAKPVKELRRQQLAPKGLERGEVRRLLREVELREDLRAGAIFSLFLYTGCRVSDLVALELHDLMLSERSGTAVFRFAKGNKQRSVPLPLPARQAFKPTWNLALRSRQAKSSSGNEAHSRNGASGPCATSIRPLPASACIPTCCGTRWRINILPSLATILSAWPKFSAMRI